MLQAPINSPKIAPPDDSSAAAPGASGSGGSVSAIDSLAKIIAIGAGGCAGSVLRYLLAGVVQGGSVRFPIGTLVVNVTGCLAIGFLAQRLNAIAVDPAIRAGVLIGVLGGYTTFSTFSLETLKLAEDRQYAAALLNVAGSAGACLIAVWAGQRLAEWMTQR